MTDAKNVETGGMGRRISEVRDLLDTMTIIDAAATVDFVGKLASENGWSRDHAEAVYAEYLRFLLMAWMSPSMVVPSHDVDQAWHLHLTHTRHYWDVLCGRILMKALHHDPALGTMEDAGRHEDHYASTLSLYRYLFDQDAPHRIWPQSCDACERRTADVVLSSSTSATGMAISLAVALAMVMSGHPVVAMICFSIGACLLVLTIGQAIERRQEVERHSRGPAVSLGKGRSSRATWHGGAVGRSNTSDSSGSDAALAFTSWVDPGPSATSHHASHHSSSDHSGSNHSTHSCSSSSHSGHSCGGGGHSCGSSCGGGGCGGGGD